MKILLIHQFFVNETEPGGSRHIGLCRHFAAKGHQVEVIAGSVNYLTAKSYNKEEDTKPLPKNITIHRVPVFKGLQWGLAGRLISYCSFLIGAVIFGLFRQCDIIVATSPPIFSAIAGFILAVIKHVPWVMEIRDLWPLEAIQLGFIRSPIILRIARYIENFLYKTASHFVVLMPSFAKYLQSEGIKDTKISTIPNGVDNFIIDPPPLNNNNKTIVPISLDKTKFWVIYIGAHGKPNGLFTLLTAAMILKDNHKIQFALIGDGREKKALMEYAMNNQLSNVRFFSPQPRQFMGYIIPQAHIGILTLPAIRTMFLPNKIFDYLACACPTILSTSKGDASNLIDEAGAGICVTPEDPESLAQAICHLYDNPEKRKIMGENGRGFVLTHYKRETLADQYLDLLQHLVQK